MGNQTDLIQEIYTRLNTATGTGKSLVAVKHVRVGIDRESRKMNDYPIIEVRYEGGRETDYAQANTKVNEMEIAVSLVHYKLDNDDNNIYKVAGTTGPLYLFETMKNVIDNNTAGALDRSFNQKANSLPIVTDEVEETSDHIIYTAKYTVETKQFTAGAR